MNLRWSNLTLGLMCLFLCGCERAQQSNKEQSITKETSDPQLFEPEPVGRYQIVSGTATLADGTTKHLILKIDSATGKTWMYMRAKMATGGRDFPQYLEADGWSPLSDDFSSSLDEVKSVAEKFKSGEYKAGE